MADRNKNKNTAKPATQVQKTRDKSHRKHTPKNVNTVPSKERLTIYLSLAFILVYTTLVFSNIFHNSFLLWDDTTYINNNLDIRGLGWSNLHAIFTNFYVGNWQPLTILSYAFEYKLAGVSSPVLYHFDNLLLHLLNVVLVFSLGSLITGKKKVGLLAALLFAIHPLRVESVTWLAERKDVLYSCFFLLGLVFYHYYLVKGLGITREGETARKPDRNKSVLYYVMIVVAFCLSGMAKSAAVVLPVVALLFDFLYKRKMTPGLFLEKIPLFLIALFFGYMAMKSQSIERGIIISYSFVERILMVTTSITRYLYMTFVPVGLSTLHPWPLKSGGGLPAVYYLGPIINIAILAGLYFSFKKTRYWIFGFFFFLVTIALVLQFVPVGYAIISERYTYIPHVGIFLVISYFLFFLWEKKFENQRLYRIVIAIITAGYIGFCSVETYKRNFVWKDALSLFDDAVAKYPNASATAYYERALARKANKDFKGALEDLNEALRINPNYYLALNNSGNLKLDFKDYKGAIADYDKALRLDTTNYLGFRNRAIAKREMKDYQGAIRDFYKVVQLQPQDIEGRCNWAIGRSEIGDNKGAIEELNQVLIKKPGYATAYLARGLAKFNLADKQGACEDWKAGAQLGDEGCKQNVIRLCN